MTRASWFIIAGVTVGICGLLYWFKLKPILDTADKATASFDKFVDWANKGLAL